MARQRIDAGEVTATAAELADTNGLDDLTLSKVADELGVQASALYNHVDGVEGLRHAVAVTATEHLADRLRDAAIGRSGDAAIDAVAGAYRAFARAHPGQYAAALMSSGEPDEGLEAAVVAIVHVFTRVMHGFGMAGTEAVHAARSVRSAIHGFVALEATGGLVHGADPDDSFDHLLGLIRRGLQT